MRKISLWAKHHRIQAIAFLVVIKLLLAVLAFYLGSVLLNLNVHIPFYVFIIALVALLIAAWLYPSRSRHSSISKNRFYAWQKSCDFLVATCSFVMIGTLVNTNLPIPGSAVSFASNVVTNTTPTAEEILASLQYRDKSTLTRQEKRILKEEFKKQLKIYAIAKIKGDKGGASKTLPIILTIIAAVGLFFLVAAIACNLSCNGSDAAAVIVGVLGTALIIWGAVVLIKRISGGPKKDREGATEPGK